MIGAIAGDIIGSVHERANIKQLDFQLFQKNSSFTDDTALTLAIADAILNEKPYALMVHNYGNTYSKRGYGGMFRKWLKTPLDQIEPYNSFGNGSAMRVSPVAWAFKTIDRVLEEARRTAIITHNHPEGVKGAQAIAAAIHLAHIGKDKKVIKNYIQKQFDYDLDRTVEQIRPKYKFDVTCQGSVPESIIAFLDSDNLEHAIRLGISLGGDADTIACMAGAIAQAYYKEIPMVIYNKVKEILGADLWRLVKQFEEIYKINYKLLA
ncbi:MAG: hypothetical protein GY810_26525 [Aureispira sp.]|nr:hypothetical protein [Aureispira sp.]